MRLCLRLLDKAGQTALGVAQAVGIAKHADAVPYGLLDGVAHIGWFGIGIDLGVGAWYGECLRFGDFAGLCVRGTAQQRLGLPDGGIGIA